MSALGECQPQELLRCGVVFGQAAEVLLSAQVLAGRSAQVRWRGRTGCNYQQLLGSLSAELGALRASYDGACDVLLRYARVLEQAKALADEADVLGARADSAGFGDLFGAPGMVGEVNPHPLQVRADALMRQAVELEEQAGLTAAAALDDLTYRAPKAPVGAGASRFLADVGTSVAGQVVGAATFSADLVRSLPFVGADDNRAKARHDSLEAAKAMAQPWLAVEQMLQQLDSGRGGLAAGAAVGVIITHKLDLSALAKNAPLFKGHSLAKGFLRGLPQGVLSIADQGQAWALAHEVKQFQDETARLRRSGEPLPGDWLDRPVNLQHHEARGGHTLLKHVGASTDLLLWRLRLEGGAERSTFSSVEQAPVLVRQAIVINRVAVEGFRTVDKAERRTFWMPVGEQAGTILAVDGAQRPAKAVVVVLAKVDDKLMVFSAYLGSKPALP